MTFEQKKARAIALMDSKKMWRSNYAPPLLRILWRLGIRLPPLPFMPFWQVTGTQVLLYIGASCFPMPGASGASEGTFYLAFSPLFGDYLTTAMLIWRLASYYLTIVLGYIAVVAERITLRHAAQ